MEEGWTRCDFFPGPLIVGGGPSVFSSRRPRPSVSRVAVPRYLANCHFAPARRRDPNLWALGLVAPLRGIVGPGLRLVCWSLDLLGVNRECARAGCGTGVFLAGQSLLEGGARLRSVVNRIWRSLWRVRPRSVLAGPSCFPLLPPFLLSNVSLYCCSIGLCLVES